MITGRDVLDIADALGELPGEAAMRSRIGRLHYGVYLNARTYCETHLGHSRARLAREYQVIATLLRSIDPQLEVEMRFLRKARNEADYEEHLPGDYVEDLLDRSVVSSARLLAYLDALQDRR